MLKRLKDFVFMIGVPVVVGLLVFAFYGFKWTHIYDMMGMTFFIFFPYIIGVVSILRADIEKIKSIKYRIFHPWKILGIVLLITIVLAYEGWACWIMLFPFLAIFSSIGGLVAGHFRDNRQKTNQQINVSLMLLIPLVLSPLESTMRYDSKVVETTTTINVKAPASKIWDNITDVYTITPKEDSGYLSTLLAFPRPLQATLDKRAVGGYRKAIFTDGLVFHERVTKYKDQKEMLFEITANTHEIPSTTLDSHLLIGGDYFDMIDGEYKLEKIDENSYKIILTSHFMVTTSFNWYAGALGEMIMYDIQRNILGVIKGRSEG